MDFPVITAARTRGSSLTVAGYVGSAAGQSTFGSARVELFVSDNDASGYGEGQTDRDPDHQRLGQLQRHHHHADHGPVDGGQADGHGDRRGRQHLELRRQLRRRGGGPAGQRQRGCR
jgi:hypothetical protein